MSNIDKQALREEFRNMQDHYSDPADRERQEIYIAAEAAVEWFAVLDIPGMEKLVDQQHTNDPLDVTPAKAKKMADIVEAWTPPEGWSGGMDAKMKGYIVEFLRGCNGFRSH